MQRPGGDVSGHMGSSCVHLFSMASVRSGLKWTPLADVISRRHHPRKRMIQYSRAAVMVSSSRRYLTPRWSLSSGSPKARPGGGYDSRRPACFPPLLAPNKGREIGGGRATRQPGQVRKEAALTRSGSGRSSVSYLFFRTNRANGGDQER